MTALEASQASAVHANLPKPTLTTETKRENVKFDASRFDREKFNALVHELVGSEFRESCESSKEHTAGDTPSPFIIVGWFARGSSDPYERLIKLKDEQNLFKQLRKKISFIRGWREYVSLRSLRGFGLYEVRSLFTIFYHVAFFCAQLKRTIYSVIYLEVLTSSSIYLNNTRALLCN